MFTPLPPLITTGAPASRVVIFNDNKMLVATKEDGSLMLPEVKSLNLDIAEHLVVGSLYGEVCGAVFMTELPECENCQAIEIRLGIVTLPFYESMAMIRGREIYFWLQKNKFCGACAAPLIPNGTDSGLRCTHCRNQVFPVLAPAVIVAVLRGRDILLAHNSRWQDGLYGILAGFIEAGENAEHAIEREILEEVNIKVKNIRYYDSQCWPFPNSLMFGYVCEYESGEIEVDGEEITDAKWFTPEDMPMTPPTGSIANRIIASFKAGELYE